MASTEPALRLENVCAGYGASRVLHGVSFDVRPGEVVSLLGRNGAGKTTTLLAIMGRLKPSAGQILLAGDAIGGRAPYRLARAGLGFVPQEREIFPSLTVRENLTTMARISPGAHWTLDRVFSTFPRLDERGGNYGSQLSGGEQQMLAIARALLLNPRILLLDEPSEGLAPLIVQEICTVVVKLQAEGMAIVLVEQNLDVALSLATRHHVLNKGEIRFEGTTEELRRAEDVHTRYLSV